MAKRKADPMITIDPEFRDMIPRLTDAEFSALEKSIRKAGRALEPVTVWKETGILLDGHNRYTICQTAGLPFSTRQQSFADRKSALSWMFDHQISRRNLSPDQIVALAAARGVFCDRGTARQRSMADALAGAGKLAPVLSGSASLAQAHGAWLRATGQAPARAPRGPSTTPYVIPPGQELTGRSTLLKDGAEVAAWDKTGRASEEPEFDPEAQGHLVTRTATYRRADGSFGGRWLSTKPDEIAREKAALAAFERHASLYAGLAGTSTRPAVTDDQTITLYPLGDPHIGMLSWAPETGDSHDLKIACRDLRECVQQLAAAAPSSGQAIVTNLGDFFHAQDDRQVTPGHGHKLDVDGRHAKVFDAGLVLVRSIVDELLTKHGSVKVRNLPGNHDPQEASRIASWLRAVYEREPRVVVAPAYAAYQFDRFGSCLFGWCHGDGAKDADLPLVMAEMRREDWGQTTERHWHRGHKHHWERKEYTGCVVEGWRTMAGKDAWHAAKAYSSGRSLTALTYHHEFGEVSRVTVNLAKVRAALAGKVA